MRFLMTTGESSGPADEALFTEMGAFVEDVSAASQMVATGGLVPDAGRLISSGDEMTVTVGPFTETKEAPAADVPALDSPPNEPGMNSAKDGTGGQHHSQTSQYDPVIGSRSLS